MAVATDKAPGARRRSPWLATVVPVALFAAWLAATTLVPVFAPHQLPSPRRVLAAVLELAQDGALVTHMLASVGRVAAGFSVGAAAAVLVGVGVGLSRTVETLLDPTLQVVRNVPSLAWAPLLLLWLGIDEAPRRVGAPRRAPRARVDRRLRGAMTRLIATSRRGRSCSSDPELSCLRVQSRVQRTTHRGEA